MTEIARSGLSSGACTGGGRSGVPGRTLGAAREDAGQPSRWSGSVRPRVTGEPLFSGPAGDRRRWRVDAADFDDVQVGGEGLVYRATLHDSQHCIALKMLTSRRLDDYPMLAERAALLDGVSHPHLMTHGGIFLAPALAAAPQESDEDAVIYSVADWIDGVPLVQAARQATTRSKLKWVLEIARAVGYLHSIRKPGAPAGIVHCDIKPSNVRVRVDGTAVILDYGLARSVAADDLSTEIGTYQWRAPELLDRASPRGFGIDTWGVGAIAHWLLIGQPPRLDGGAAARERLIASPAMAQLGNSNAICCQVARLLESSPSERPADLELWSAELERLLQHRRTRPQRLRVLASAGLSLAVLGMCAASEGKPATVEEGSGVSIASSGVNGPKVVKPADRCVTTRRANSYVRSLAMSLDNALIAEGSERLKSDPPNREGVIRSIVARLEADLKTPPRVSWGQLEPVLPGPAELANTRSEFTAFLYWWVNAELIISTDQRDALKALKAKVRQWARLASRASGARAPCHTWSAALRCVNQFVLVNARNNILHSFSSPAKSQLEADERMFGVAFVHSQGGFEDPTTGKPGTLTAQLNYCESHS